MFPFAVSHGSWVRVAYSGLPAPTSSVFFALFYPADANVSAVAALPYPAEAPFIATAAYEWIMCSDMPGCTTGAGFYDFELVNTFKTAIVWAFSGGVDAPKAIASTQPLVFTDAELPMRGHLALTADESEMRVIWHSQFADADAQVQWGYSSGSYAFSAPSETSTYMREDLCGFPTSVATSVGWSEPFFWHYARITGLTPGSSGVVYYRYGSASHGFSEELTFRPAPKVAAAQPEPVHIIAIADMGMTPYDGTQNHWQEPDAGITTDNMRRLVQSGTGYDYSLALHAGDIVYSTGYALKWDLFCSRLAGVADRVPYMLGQGNHASTRLPPPTRPTLVSNPSL